jgi:hypothetical protein
MLRTATIPRTQIRDRRWRLLLVAAPSAAVIAIIIRILDDNLYHSTFFSGYLLATAILFLAGFNVVKRLYFLSFLGTASIWMQLHIYVGLLSGAIFGVHIGWEIPNGQFEGLLAFLFVSTFASGVYGLIISRLLPRKLAALRTQIIFEQIPVRRGSLVAKAQAVIDQIPNRNDTLKRFYINRVAAFLVLPRSIRFFLTPSARESRQLIDDLISMDRYLSIDDRESARQLMQIIREKDDLDYHWAIQSRLKYWLFVHLALTYSLLICGALHGVLAHAFGGGLR